MSWFCSPIKLFAYSGIALFLVRILFAPTEFSGTHLHSWVRFFDLQVDLTGYGFFDFFGFIFLISALAYLASPSFDQFDSKPCSSSSPLLADPNICNSLDFLGVLGQSGS